MLDPLDTMVAGPFSTVAANSIEQAIPFVVANIVHTVAQVMRQQRLVQHVHDHCLQISHFLVELPSSLPSFFCV